MSRREIPGYCTLCRSRCGTLNIVEDDRLLEVRAQQGHPTGRATCAKGRAAPEIVHSTQRLTRPLKRTQPKGAEDPGWQEISWNEALDTVASRLADIRDTAGPEAVAFTVASASGAPIADSIDWIERFVRMFGSPNICYSTEICNWHKDFAHAFTFGCGIPNPEYAASDLVILWGHTPSNAWLAQAGEIGEGQKRGAKLLVVDPRRTAHASRADHWLQVRPGCDVALALGIINLLIVDRLYDDRFVRLWTNGPFLVRADSGEFLRGRDLSDAHPAESYIAVEQDSSSLIICDTRMPPDPRLTRASLRRSIEVVTTNGVISCKTAFGLLAEQCAKFTPERTSRLSGVAAADIRAAANCIGEAGSISYYAWTGVAQHVNATQTERAIAILYALTGAFDAPGGNVILNRQPANRVNDLSLLSRSQRQKALGIDERPLGPPAQCWITARDLYAAILERKPYPVRALVGFGSNLLVSQADIERGVAALERLEFFVHCDLFETPTAKYADIILPVNSPWEREALKLGFEISAAAEELIQLRPAMIPSAGQSRSDASIVFELAERLGFADSFFNGSIEAGWNYMLEPLGLTVEELRAAPLGVRRPLKQDYRKYADPIPSGVRGFATESGRVELYSEKLLRFDYSALPGFDDDIVAERETYPFTLTSAKTGYYCHSQHRSLSSLRRRAPDPLVYLSRELAADKSIVDGDWTIVRTRAGQASFRAKIDAALDPSVVVADYGWWQSCADLGLPGYDALEKEGSNYNALISSDRHDPISGSVAHRSFPCTVEKKGSSAPGWEGFKAFYVASLEQEARGVVSVTLRAKDGARLPEFVPGQHIQLRVNVVGKGTITRAYSLSHAAQAGDRRTYRITVRHISVIGSNGDLVQGDMSSHITVELSVGDVVEIKQASGSFMIPTECEFPVVLVAAGIGITPFMSHLETLVGIKNAPEVLLLYGNRCGSTHAFKRRIRELKAYLPNLQVVDSYSRPEDTDIQGTDFDLSGRLTTSVFDHRLTERRARFYLCGPLPMLRDFERELIALGVPKFEIFQERFGSVGETSAPAKQAFKVIFKRSGQVGIWSPEKGTLLELAESLGLKADSGCRVGQCESCAVTVLDGSFQYRSALEQFEPDVCLSCQAIPTSDLTLDV